MSIRITALALAAAMLTSGVALGQSADDRKWVTRCLSDNRDAKVSAAVVNAYCVCMNNKMSDSETRTITQWEKANPTARRSCEREAGWN